MRGEVSHLKKSNGMTWAQKYTMWHPHVGTDAAEKREREILWGNKHTARVVALASGTAIQNLGTSRNEK